MLGPPFLSPPYPTWGALLWITRTQKGSKNRPLCPISSSNHAPRHTTQSRHKKPLVSQAAWVNLFYLFFSYILSFVLQLYAYPFLCNTGSYSYPLGSKGTPTSTITSTLWAHDKTIVLLPLSSPYTLLPWLDKVTSTNKLIVPSVAR